MKQQKLACFLKNDSSSLKKRKLSHGSKFAACPLCNKSFPMHILPTHAGTCIGDSSSSLIDRTPNAAPSRGTPTDVTDTTNSPKNDEVSTLLPTSSDLKKTNKRKSSKNSTDWWKRAQEKQKKRTIENVIPASSEPIPGLHLFHNFITEEEESIILSELDDEVAGDFLPWKIARFNGLHRGKRWGVHCNLRDRRVGAAENPMPNFFRTILCPRLERIEQMMTCVPNEANAIDYRRGDYLSDHVDDRQLSKEPIANLSLAGDCYMTFINQKQQRQEHHRVLLPRRTLQVLTGKARYDFSHGIRKADFLADRRVSVTMRESPLTKT